MFKENQFYPTPREVIEQMVRPLVEVGYRETRYIPGKRNFLEPSAGKGDIADYLVDRRLVGKREMSCIEIDPNLRHILSDKGYKVVDSDFLEYDGRERFNLIIMNPPFSNGVDHLLKAWEVLYEGDLVCLLNAETVRNPYTRKRELLCNIIQQYGRYKEIGQPFASGEVPTDVEVAIVWLHKPLPEPVLDFTNNGFERDIPVSEEEFAANPLAHANIIQSLVSQYKAAVRILEQKHDLDGQFNFYTSSVMNPWGKDDKEGESVLNIDHHSLSEKISELREKFWRYVFVKTNIGKATTSDFQRQFDQYRDEMSNMAFSVSNIYNVLKIFYDNRGEIMRQCVLEVFDQATKYHEKNQVHFEGWKTNKSWRIAQKIIIPYGIDHDPKWGTWRVPFSGRGDFFDDLDKVMAYLDGNRKIDNVFTIRRAMENRIELLRRHDADYQTPFKSAYFTIRFFKKGTVHLTFLRDDLLEMLNRIAAEDKNWIGGGY